MSNNKVEPNPFNPFTVTETGNDFSPLVDESNRRQEVTAFENSGGRQNVPLDDDITQTDREQSSEVLDDGNPLYKYHTNMYNLEWFMAKLDLDAAGDLRMDRYSVIDDLTSVGNLPDDGGSKYVLAKTGASELIISKFELVTIHTSTGSESSMPSIKARMTITEPNGCTLPEKIIEGIKTLDLGSSPISVPTYLNIWFTGRSTTNAPEVVKFGTEQISKQTIRFKVVRIRTKMDSNGSQYEIELVGLNSLALQKTAVDLDYEVTITSQELKKMKSIKDVLGATGSNGNYEEGELFKKIGQTAKHQAQRVLNESDGELKYNIIMSSLREKSVVIFEGFNDQELEFAINSKSTENKAFNIEDLKVNSKTDIVTVIRSLMKHTRLHYAVVDRPKKEKSGNLSSVDYYTIETDVRPVSYSEDANRNIYDYYYIVRKRRKARVDVTGPARFKKESLLSNEYTQYGVYLYKQYNYIFTGKNQSVIDFDVEIDFTWHRALRPDNLSKFMNSVNAPGKKAQTNDVRTTAESDTAPSANLVTTKSTPSHSSDAEFFNTVPSYVYDIADQKEKSHGVIGDTRDGVIIESESIVRELFEDFDVAATGEIKIQGDPDWLSFNLPYDQYIYLQVNNMKKDLAYENKPGTKPDPAMTNVYRVLEVTHVFDEGNFTQTLNLVRPASWYVSVDE